MTKKRSAEATATLFPEVDAKDEMNLAEFPIALLTDRPPSDKTSLVFQDSINDPGSRKKISRKLTITAPVEYGLPRGIDEDVIVALVQLTKLKNNFTNRKVRFTRNELIDLLGWPGNGKNYDRLTASLYRWTAATLAYENAWWAKDEQRWTSKIFHIIEECEINDSRSNNGQQQLLTSEIVWNETVFQSFVAGNLRDLDYRLYLRLEYATSKRMFRFLDKRFYHSPTLRFDLRDFAFAHIGLSQTYANNVGKIKEKLANAIDELTEAQFLASLTEDERYLKSSRGWEIVFKKHEAKPTLSGEILDKQNSEIVMELIKRGVTPDVAPILEAKYSIESIRFQIEHFDWLIATKDKKAPRGGGWFVDALAGNYRPPLDFKSQSQRDQEEEARREKARKAAEAKRLLKEKEAREEQEYQARIAAVETHLAGLTSDALEQLDLEFRADGKHGSGRIVFREQLFNAFMAKKLGLIAE